MRTESGLLAAESMAMKLFESSLPKTKVGMLKVKLVRIQ